MEHYLDRENNGQSLDMSDTESSTCICGNRWFKTILTLDENNFIAAYGLDVECVECGTRLKLPMPLDNRSGD